MSKWKDQDSDPNTDLDPDSAPIFSRTRSGSDLAKRSGTDRVWIRPGPDPDQNSVPMTEQAPHRKLHLRVCTSEY
jgi:hypothetical protein